MTSRRRAFAVLAFVAVLLACNDQSGPVSPSTIAAARVGALVSPGPPNQGLAGRLGGLAALLQVQDARLSALADAWQDLCPEPGDPCPEPDQPLLAALAAINSAASSIAGRAAELERLAGGSQPPDPAHPPDPGLPSNLCFPPSPIVPGDRQAPPDPCLLGVLGSIGNVLATADVRLAGITDPCPDSGDPCPDSGAVAALANIKAAAMSLAETASTLAAIIGK